MLQRAGRLDLFLVCATFLAIVLRVWLIFYVRKEPASDEIWALFLSRADFSDIWMAAFSDLHGPFYFLFLHAIAIISGIDLTINFLRVISLIFGLLSSLAIFYLTLGLLSKKAVYVAFILSLFLPSFLWSSVYGRYYSLLILLTIFALYFFKQFLASGYAKYLLFLSLILAIGTYTHYYFILVDFAFGVAIFFGEKRGVFFKKWLLKSVASLILLLPAAYYFFTLPKPDIAGRHTNDILKIPAIVVTNFTSWESLTFLYFRGDPIKYLPVIAALSICVLGLMRYGYLNWPGEFKKVLASLVVVPPVVAGVFSYTIQPLLALNSLLIFLPAYILLLANGICFDLRAKKVLTILFIISIFVSLILFIQSSKTLGAIRRDFTSILSEFKSSDIILHFHLYSYLNGVYYFGRDSNFAVEDSSLAPLAVARSLRIKTISLDELLKAESRIWLVEPQGNLSEKIKNIRENLSQSLGVSRAEIYQWNQDKYQEYYFNVYLFER